MKEQPLFNQNYDHSSASNDFVASPAFKWSMLFVGLAVSADDFFCPNLNTISKTLR